MKRSFPQQLLRYRGHDMAKNLVIVESPAKAKTINKFLGSDFLVKASMGHVKDLPKSKLGVDPDNNFEPHYITIRTRTKLLKELKALAKKKRPERPQTWRSSKCVVYIAQIKRLPLIKSVKRLCKTHILNFNFKIL